jgi:hypothetical protein
MALPRPIWNRSQQDDPSTTPCEPCPLRQSSFRRSVSILARKDARGAVPFEMSMRDYDDVAPSSPEGELIAFILIGNGIESIVTVNMNG